MDSKTTETMTALQDISQWTRSGIAGEIFARRPHHVHYQGIRSPAQDGDRRTKGHCWIDARTNAAIL